MNPTGTPNAISIPFFTTAAVSSPAVTSPPLPAQQGPSQMAKALHIGFMQYHHHQHHHQHHQQQHHTQLHGRVGPIQIPLPSTTRVPIPVVVGTPQLSQPSPSLQPASLQPVPQTQAQQVVQPQPQQQHRRNRRRNEKPDDARHPITVAVTAPGITPPSISLRSPPTNTFATPPLSPTAGAYAEEGSSIFSPWYRTGCPRNEVTLAGEIAAFFNLMRLTAQECQVRKDLVSIIQEAAEMEWGNDIEVIVYGSFATRDTCSPASAVDVVIEGCKDAGEDAVVSVFEGVVNSMVESDIRARITAVVQLTGEVPSRESTSCGSGVSQGLDTCNSSVESNYSGLSTAPSTPPSSTISTLVKLDTEHTVLNITCYNKHIGLATASNSLYRTWLAECPCAPEVHAVLRRVLTQTGNMDIRTGGLSGYSLLAMIIAVSRMKDVREPDSLLLEVCATYGSADLGDIAICPTKGVLKRSQFRASLPPGQPSRHLEDPLLVCDPLNPLGNLAAGVTRTITIKAQLAHCRTSLSRWTAEDAASTSSSTAYKGRTPLSSIISHQQLWPRAQLLTQATKVVVGGQTCCDTNPRVVLKSQSSMCSSASVASHSSSTTKRSFPLLPPATASMGSGANTPMVQPADPLRLHSSTKTPSPSSSPSAGAFETTSLPPTPPPPPVMLHGVESSVSLGSTLDEEYQVDPLTSFELTIDAALAQDLSC